MKARDWPFETIEMHCAFCQRTRNFRKATFIELVGAETELPTARRVISQNCPVWKDNPDHMRTNCQPQYTQDWYAAGK